MDNDQNQNSEANNNMPPPPAPPPVQNQPPSGGINDDVKAANAEPTAGETMQGNPGPEFSGKKIMWVEDDKFLSDLLAKKLNTVGSKLVHAQNGKEALELVPKEMPDVMLLDILLPDINGFDVLEKIKMNEATKGIPVILLSNLGQQADIDKGMNLGAEKYLIKATVTLEEIVEEVKKVLLKK